MSFKSLVGESHCHPRLGTTEGKYSLSPCRMSLAEFGQRESMCDKVCQWATVTKKHSEGESPVTSHHPRLPTAYPEHCRRGVRERRTFLGQVRVDEVYTLWQ